jgi:hypothetical protein
VQALGRWVGRSDGWGRWRRRLACDGAITRVLVSRQPTAPCGGNQYPSGQAPHGLGDSAGHHHPDPTSGPGLAEQLRTAAARLPPVLGGAPRQPLDVGRTTRVVQPAQRLALAVRDGGCVFRGRDRPLAWWEGHHRWPWLDGGPTDLDSLSLLCRAHHRAVHEGGWRLTRRPTGG